MLHFKMLNIVHHIVSDPMGLPNMRSHIVQPLAALPSVLGLTALIHTDILGRPTIVAVLHVAGVEVVLELKRSATVLHRAYKWTVVLFHVFPEGYV